MPDLDLGHDLDHTAVAAELRWSCQAPLPSAAKQNEGNTNCSLQLRTGLLGLHAHGLGRSAVPTWTTDIGSHVDSFNRCAHTWMKKHAQPAVPVIKRPYVATELWTLRAAKLQYRRELRGLQRESQHTLLRTCFAAWRSREHPVVEYASDTFRCLKLAALLR